MKIDLDSLKFTDDGDDTGLNIPDTFILSCGDRELEFKCVYDGVKRKND